MADFDYAAIAARLQAGQIDRRNDAAGIMALLGYEVAPHGRLGMACRPVGETHWISLPNFDSADDFELWALGKYPGLELNDAGHNPDGFYAGVEHPEFGNDYGNGRRLGAAMWAAFVRLIGRVGGEDD